MTIMRIGKNILFVQVNAHHVNERSWQEKGVAPHSEIPSKKSRGGPKVKSGASRRLIVSHIGSAEGFLAPCKDVFEGKKGTADYHNEMNIPHFNNWLEECVPHMPDNALIVLDNALYHNHVLPENRKPTTAWRVGQIKAWLDEKNIPYDPAMRKPEILEIARRQQIEKLYETDKIAAAENRGLEVIRLPIGHCELNPIEKIWAWIKQRVASRNKEQTMASVLRLTNQVIAEVTPELWASNVQHVKGVEDEYKELDYIVDTVPDVQPLIIENDDSDDDDYWEFTDVDGRGRAATDNIDVHEDTLHISGQNLVCS